MPGETIRFNRTDTEPITEANFRDFLHGMKEILDEIDDNLIPRNRYFSLDLKIFKDVNFETGVIGCNRDSVESQEVGETPPRDES